MPSSAEKLNKVLLRLDAASREALLELDAFKPLELVVQEPLYDQIVQLRVALDRLFAAPQF